MPVDLSLALTYGAIFLSKASFHSSRVGLTPKRVFVLVVAKGTVTRLQLSYGVTNVHLPNLVLSAPLMGKAFVCAL